jgi:putative DNA primase/helicase
VVSHGLRVAEDGRLLVPVQDADGKLWSLQHVGRDGFKQFHENGRVEGGHYAIGNLGAPGPVVIAEGYATAATVHEMTDLPAVVAFNAGNLAAVAQACRARYPERTIYIAGDNDHRREAEGKPNVGREKAEQAANSVGGFTLLPVFAEHNAGSDWNDLARSEGRDTARQQLMAAVTVAEREQIVQGLAAARDRGHDRDQPRSLAFDRERTAEAETER